MRVLALEALRSTCFQSRVVATANRAAKSSAPWYQAVQCAAYPIATRAARPVSRCLPTRGGDGMQEDHTLGNLLATQLLHDPRVLYAGYRVPHPLENHIELKIQVSASSSTLAFLLP